MFLAQSDPNSLPRQQVAMGFLKMEMDLFTKAPDKVGLHDWPPHATSLTYRRL